MKRQNGALLALGALSILILFSVGLAQKSTHRRHINLPERTDSVPYSNAVLAGDTLYLAGAIGIDPATGAPPPDVKKEIAIVLDSMKRRLEMVGMSMDDLVTVDVFCPDLALYEDFNTVYRTYFKERFPARAFIGSGPLLRGGRFEVSGVAVK